MEILKKKPNPKNPNKQQQQQNPQAFGTIKM